MEYDIINACSDLGVHVNGASKGPLKICEDFSNVNINKKYTVIQNDVNKSLDINDKKKNLDEINLYNKKLYNTIIKSNNFPIILGGDHSIVIASALASIKKHGELGIIWIDSHGDYNNFETTLTGNIHGLPFAAITNYSDTQKLTTFHNGNYYNPKNSVLVGARDIDKLELKNLKDAGVKIFTTNDIKKYGVKKVMEEAFIIASNNTNGIHISYDIDVIDPLIAPGVSIPAIDGINEDCAYEIMNYISKNKSKVKSIDLVEYNPLLDKNNKTLEIVLNLLNIFVK